MAIIQSSKNRKNSSVKLISLDRIGILSIMYNRRRVQHVMSSLHAYISQSWSSKKAEGRAGTPVPHGYNDVQDLRRGLLKRIPKHMLYQKKLMKDPVLAEDNNIYERNSIEEWFEKGNTTSPTTNAEIGTHLVPQLSLKLEIDTWMKQNISMLHMACSNGDVEIVRGLIQKDMSADLINRKDLDRTSPLQYALRFEHDEIISILRNCDNIVDTGKRSLDNFGDDDEINSSTGYLRVPDDDFEKEWKTTKRQLRGKDIKKNRGIHSFNFQHKINVCTGGFLARYPKKFQCRLSRSIFNDPVIAEDGLTYSRNKIEQWFVKFNLSPLTNEKIGQTLVPNLALKIEVDEWIAANTSELHMACIHGNLDKVQHLNIQDMDADTLNGVDQDNKTAIETAANYGHAKIVSLLLTCENIVVNLPVPIPSTNQYRRCNRHSALVWATHHGNVEIVSMLLEDIRVNTAIALQVAVMEGYSDVVRLLLKHPRVDVNEVGTENDMTALHWAACNFENHENVVQDFLDESRVDVNVLDRRQETPLHAAVSRGEVTSVRILIADPRVETSTPGWRNYTPLLTACDGESVCENYDRHSMEDRVEMIKALLESETINTTEVDKEGNTPLAVCLTGHDSPYSPDICAAMAMEFLKRGIGLDKVSTWYGIDKCTHLVRFWLYNKVRSLQKESQLPMSTFQLCRLSAAHGANLESSLRVFTVRWPLLVSALIEDFLFPKQELRVGFEQIVTHYKDTYHNEDGYALKTLTEICRSNESYPHTQYDPESLRCFLGIGAVGGVNTPTTFNLTWGVKNITITVHVPKSVE